MSNKQDIGDPKDVLDVECKYITNIKKEVACMNYVVRVS